MDEFTVKGLEVSIEQDVDAESPREWSNLGTFVAFHGRYQLGDKTEFGYRDPEAFEEWRKEHVKDIAVILPVYLYDHSGLRVKVGSFQGLLPQGHAEFDSGQIGYIYATRETVRKGYGVKRITKATLAKVEANLRGEIETYDQYLSGDVYWYSVRDPETNEVLDSLGGLFGFDYAKKEATSAAESLAEQKYTRETTGAGDVPDVRGERG